MADLLIELFSEEIPARMQARAADDLRRLVTDGLVDAGLTYASAGAFATPRRLVLTVEGLPEVSPTTREERKGPRADAPEKAIEGFLRGAGVPREALETRETPKGAVLFATITHEGRPAAEIVSEVLERTIRQFPWPKSMRWGSGSLRWVRPLHSILCILSDDTSTEVVPLEVEGIAAGNTTRGHRFMAPAPIEVRSFEEYRAALKRAFVLLDSTERAEAIRADAESRAFAAGLELVPDEGLLAEIAGLVEWPVVLMGRIEERFLDLPPEVLQTSMKEHQKFLSLRAPKTGRIEGFITVANVETRDDGATILAGNQKVLAARLSDAAFFWQNDLRIAKAGMGEWLDSLENVTFQSRLGSQGARIARIADLARDIASALGADPEQAARAARLAKADLSSEMVYEFPELQGIMGRYYAEAAGESAAVAGAAAEHYLPLGPSDPLPEGDVATAVALADKIDLLTGFWAIDEKPTGSKDPFALRRAALGVIRILLGRGTRLHLDRYFDAQLLRHKAALGEDDAAEVMREKLTSLLDAIAEHGVFGAAWRSVTGEAETPQALPDASDDLLGFFHDRLKVHLKGEGLRHDVVSAVLVGGADDLSDVVARAEALSEFMASEDGENLVQGFKRANNILTQAEEADGVEYSFGADPAHAQEPQEHALFAALSERGPEIAAAMQAEDYAAAMRAMAALRAPIDAFFEAVQVNAESDLVRRNRLNLLGDIRRILSGVADLTRIEG